MRIIGIDPGQSGGAALLATNHTEVVAFGKMTDRDIAELLEEWQDPDIEPVCAYIEQVHAMPRQGVSSTFKFGRNYGFLIGCLTCYCIRYEMVTPGTWQRAMGCLSKGDKNITKAKAQQLFPQIRITHAVADALLIAEYGRRIHV